MTNKIKSLLIFIIFIAIVCFTYFYIIKKYERYIVLKLDEWESHTSVKYFRNNDMKTLFERDHAKDAYEILSNIHSLDSLEAYLVQNKLRQENYRFINNFDSESEEISFACLAQNFMVDKLTSMNIPIIIQHRYTHNSPDKFSASYNLKWKNGGDHYFALKIYKKQKLILWERCRCL